MIVFTHQESVVREIVARAQAYYAGRWKGLTIQPRWHSLLIGPTGVGKTAVATMIAERVGATMLRVSSPAWMPCGGNQSGTNVTIGAIAEAVVRNDKTLIVIDEIDKMIDRAADSSWKSHIRGEMFDLLDGRWPAGLKLPDQYDENDCPQEVPLDVLTSRLRESVYILGIGTFQDWFDTARHRRAIGFGNGENSADHEIPLDAVIEKLPRELVNRFNAKLLRLAELRPRDYEQIARQAEASLPSDLQSKFNAEVARSMQLAIESKKGVRFLEEALMEVLKNMASGHEPSPQPTRKTLPDQGIDVGP